MLDAIARLEAQGVRVMHRSSIYETEPQYVRDQPWFLNLAIQAETERSPRQLLAAIQTIEREMGRERAVSKGPRIIDIDILLFDDLVVDTPELRVPHPHLAERRFVLEPLAEIAPEQRHPVDGRTVREMLPEAPAQIVRRWPRGL